MHKAPAQSCYPGSIFDRLISGSNDGKEHREIWRRGGLNLRRSAVGEGLVSVGMSLFSMLVFDLCWSRLSTRPPK